MASSISSNRELDQGGKLSRLDSYPEDLKVALEDPALELNDLDLRELSRRICADENGCKITVSLVARQLGMEQELTKSNGILIYDLLSMWCKKEGTTVGILIAALKNKPMNRPDCVKFVDEVARYKFVMLYPFLHITAMDGQAKTDEIPAVKVPAKLSLREFVRGLNAIKEIITNSFKERIGGFTIKLKRLDQLGWDSRSGDYAGRRIDLHLYRNGNISQDEPSFAYTDDMSSIPVQSDSIDESYIEIVDNYTQLRTSGDSGGGQDNLSQVSVGSFDFRSDSAPRRNPPRIPVAAGIQPRVNRNSSRIDLDSEAFPYTEEEKLNQTNQEEQEVIRLPGFHQYLGVPPTKLREKAKTDIQQYYNKNRTDGCYLIRRSQSQSYQQPFTLNFGHQDTLHHISIVHSDGKYALHEQPDLLFVSVAELIDYYKKNDIKPNIRLSDPVPDK